MNVVVTGPESSGTRFVSRWLEAHPDLTTRHWSMPSGLTWARHWPTDHDYGSEAPESMILVLRSFEATIASQLAREMTSCREESEANIVQAHTRALAWAMSHGCPVYPVLYDQIVAAPETVEAVFRWLGVDPVPCPEQVVDGNAKWLQCVS